MKKFVIKLAILAAIMVAVDFGCGIISAKLFNLVNEEDTYKWRHITQNLDDDVLLMGSSRCARHYNPDIISDSLHIGVYNCGKEGMGILFAYGELQIILSHHTPKLIAYELTPGYDISKTAFDNSRFLKPLYGFYDLQSIKDLVCDLQPTDRYKMVSQMYRNNETIVQYFKGIMKKKPTHDNHGFKPLFGKVDTVTKRKVSDEVPEVDPVKAEYFQKFIDLCKVHDIQLVLFISPGSYDKNLFTENTYKYLIDMASANDIPVCNNIALQQFIGHPELFNDVNHLNADGANIYSTIVASQLKDFIGR